MSVIRLPPFRFLCYLMIAIGLSWLIAIAAVAQNNTAVREIPIDGAIGPATGNFVVNEIEDAGEANAPLVILRIDTPGGLSASMRDIVQAILASNVPIVGYVAPSGARAASAGTYILYATHIAAMAPATNLGAATPIQIGGGNDDGGAPPADSPDDSPKEPPAPNDDLSNAASDNTSQSGENEATDRSNDDDLDLGNAATKRRKQVNDAVAYIRSLAERRGRNADWAERAVREGDSLSAQAALDRNVIDTIANNERDLLEQIDGQTIQTASGETTLQTRGQRIETRQPGWRTDLLAIVTDPTVAYLLFMIGLVGLAAEALSPGALFPGVIGGISLLTALFAFNVLPVSYSGVALIILGVALFIAEAFVSSFGVLGLGGIAAVVFGSIMLMDTHVPGYEVSIGVIIGIAITAVIILALMVWLFARSRQQHIETGHEGLIGRECMALLDFEREGRVWLHGESWQAVTEAPVGRNQTLIVTGSKGLTVSVRPTNGTGVHAYPNNAGRRPEGS